ncbi:glycosyltransferase [Candidatus Microgenomates bacterium]|nr:MAG: glycosyltransferase [Candidatus Microgenomates bacterium]
MKLSVIIVHYKVKEILFNCIDSILKSKTKVLFEIIVVDNDEKKIIEKELKKKFPLVKYIKSMENVGFGEGNNLGAKISQGEYLFFLNPDTIVFPNTIDNLVNFINKDKKVGVVAPLLLDKNNIPYEFQGTKKLTPFRAVFALSFLNKIFPNNPVSKKYWIKNWNKRRLKEVDVVPGTAFAIKKNIFERVNGFDKKFFLYFEEFDLCNRVKLLGFKIFINPGSCVIHFWGESSKTMDGLNKIFLNSRFYYFKKNFGYLKAFLLNIFLNINKKNALLTIILLSAAFLRFFKLPDLMMFIGDQGWFYLSARDILLTGNIPLVGITSSHTWLHQGPLWTYFLALVLKVSNFNPLSGACLTAFVGVVTVFLTYKICSKLFSERIGLIAAALYAFSPLVIIHSRMAYHTSLIPLFVLIFIYIFYEYLKGKYFIFPLIITVLGILYNLELATIVLSFIFFVLLIIRVLKKSTRIDELLSRKNIILTFISFFVVMLPVLIFDFSHGFPQTIKFLIWIPYRTIKVLSTGSGNIFQFDNSMLTFFSQYFQRLIFLPDNIISYLIFASSFVFASLKIIKEKTSLSIRLVFIFFFIPFLFFYFNKTPSEAYLPILFGQTIILVAVFFDWLIGLKILRITFVLFFLFILFANAILLVSKDFLMGTDGGYGPTYAKRFMIAKEIVKKANGKSYNIVGRGAGSNFESFTMNYQYLTWLLGNEPSKNAQNLKFVIYEDLKNIKLTEINSNRSRY